MTKADLTEIVIRKEAKEILKHANALRKVENEKRRTDDGNVIKFKFVMFDDMPESLPKRGEPRPDDSAEDIFRAGLRFWAIRAASQLTGEEWRDMAYDISDQVSGPIDGISFFENLFTDLTLKDGTLIAA